MCHVLVAELLCNNRTYLVRCVHLIVNPLVSKHKIIFFPNNFTKLCQQPPFCWRDHLRIFFFFFYFAIMCVFKTTSFLVQSFPLALTPPPQKSQDQISLALMGTGPKAEPTAVASGCSVLWLARPQLHPTSGAWCENNTSQTSCEARAESLGEVRVLWTSGGGVGAGQAKMLTVHYTHRGRLYGGMLYLEAKKRVPTICQNTVPNSLS